MENITQGVSWKSKVQRMYEVNLSSKLLPQSFSVLEDVFLKYGKELG